MEKLKGAKHCNRLKSQTFLRIFCVIWFIDMNSKYKNDLPKFSDPSCRVSRSWLCWKFPYSLTALGPNGTCEIKKLGPFLISKNNKITDLQSFFFQIYAIFTWLLCDRSSEQNETFQSLAVLQVHGYLFGISSTEYLKYFKKLWISSTSVFPVLVLPVLPVIFFSSI